MSTKQASAPERHAQQDSPTETPTNEPRLSGAGPQDTPQPERAHQGLASAPRRLSLAEIDAVESRLSAPVSERMLDLAGLRPGMRVLDLGCGAGEPSLRAAQRVGERGFVFGVDPYAAAVELAREKARIQGIAWVRYEVQGAETLSPQEVLFDAALGRWSLPFMADVRGALSAARALLQPGSPLVLAAWDAAPQIAWWSVPRRVTERFASLPPVNPEAPGASRFARREALLPLAEEVGFALVDEETQQVRVYEAETLPEMESWVWAVFGRWIELVPEESRGEWRDMLHQELSASHEGGRFFLDGVTRLYVLQALGR